MSSLIFSLLKEHFTDFQFLWFFSLKFNISCYSYSVVTALHLKFISFNKRMKSKKDFLWFHLIFKNSKIKCSFTTSWKFPTNPSNQESCPEKVYLLMRINRKYFSPAQSNFSPIFKYFKNNFPIFIIIEIIVQISCDKLPVKTILTFQFSHYLNICSFCPKLC